ncbi:hypothetical protein [Acetobacter pasteurianus]|uniref:Uncharacterized protein n=1 Tax=Acetobacter pasteurianus subsp. pasteurianus TaxID=481145 RepID=A0A1Y0Y2V0_ACEPA|nr:hypothetical protein [Acetobacter pasteurianus]ARW49523.1 hypothetical protein S1001342_03233 [Acetobacter pasteurianus subsp. pasteurianus]
MDLAAIASILETVISDVPTLISVVEKLVAIFKENRVPTSDEWASINATVDAAHEKLQNG